MLNNICLPTTHKHASHYIWGTHAHTRRPNITHTYTLTHMHTCARKLHEPTHAVIERETDPLGDTRPLIHGYSFSHTTQALLALDTFRDLHRAYSLDSVQHILNTEHTRTHSFAQRNKTRERILYIHTLYQLHFIRRRQYCAQHSRQQAHFNLLYFFMEKGEKTKNKTNYGVYATTKMLKKEEEEWGDWWLVTIWGTPGNRQKNVEKKYKNRGESGNSNESVYAWVWLIFQRQRKRSILSDYFLFFVLDSNQIIAIIACIQVKSSFMSQPKYKIVSVVEDKMDRGLERRCVCRICAGLCAREGVLHFLLLGSIEFKAKRSIFTLFDSELFPSGIQNLLAY